MTSRPTIAGQEEKPRGEGEVAEAEVEESVAIVVAVVAGIAMTITCMTKKWTRAANRGVSREHCVPPDNQSRSQLRCPVIASMTVRRDWTW